MMLDKNTKAIVRPPDSDTAIFYIVTGVMQAP